MEKRENFRRIRKGYSPQEPATFLEQVFYILWTIGVSLKILFWSGPRWKRQERKNKKTKARLTHG